MAAEAQPRPPQTRKPILISKIDSFQDVVNTAVIIPKEDGVISVSQDRWVSKCRALNNTTEDEPVLLHCEPCVSSALSR